MSTNRFGYACGSASHFSRRTLLQAGGLAGLSWLTPLATQLARSAEDSRGRQKPRSVIMLWMRGGPSQLETFDPHPGTDIAAGSTAIETRQKGVLLGSGFERLAEQMDKVSLVRSVTSKEGDHERAVYNMKTGFRPDPTLVHPGLGAVVCHQLGDPEGMKVDIPRHISILPSQWPARGGYLGDQFDAFKVGDPAQPVPDVKRRVSDERFDKRLHDLQFMLEPEFSRGRHKRFDVERSLDRELTKAAVEMMSSEQLAAFDVSKVSKEDRERYGDTSFGRGCLAALRLIEVGVRCVEVTLDGWDTHANNHKLQAALISQLDPAYAALLQDLHDRDLLDDTLVVCGGEFGRTPSVNPAGGRDHWPHGFSIALSGGGIQGGRVIGETSPAPRMDEKNRLKDLVDPRPIEDIHATIFELLGVDYRQELDTPVGRPMRICEGKPISELFVD